MYRIRRYLATIFYKICDLQISVSVLITVNLFVYMTHSCFDEANDELIRFGQVMAKITTYRFI